MATQTYSLPYSFESRQANALKNAGGDPNSKLYKDWLAAYGPGGSGGAGVPNAGLAGGVNQFMTSQAILPLVNNLPGYADMVGQRSGNTMQMLRGELPNDVITQITQQAAERGIAGGSPGSPNANSAFLRGLGLTSLNMMNTGSQQLSQSIADTPVPELWNPMSLYVPQTLAAMNQNYAKQGIADQTKVANKPLEYSLSYTSPGMLPTYKYKYYA